MEPRAVTISFSAERQMEIAEIVIDGDEVAALELVKTLHRELAARGQGTCGDIFHAPAESPPTSGSNVHPENNH